MKKLFAIALFATASIAHAGGTALTGYKTEFCGCCKEWISYMQKAGYAVKVVDLEPAALADVKVKNHVPPTMASCHTAVVDGSGQVIEGHVPAAAVAKLIADSSVKGIAVPGMPANSPGMGALNGQLETVTLDGAVFSKD